MKILGSCLFLQSVRESSKIMDQKVFVLFCFFLLLFFFFFCHLVTWEVHNTIILSLPPTSRFSVLPLKHWIFVSTVPRGLTMTTLGHSLGHRVRSLWSSASPKRSFLCNLWLESLANTTNNSVRTRFGLLRNGVSGRSTDSWSKGLGFESRHERREN